MGILMTSPLPFWKVWFEEMKRTSLLIVTIVTLMALLTPQGSSVRADYYLDMLRLAEQMSQPPTLDIVFNPMGTHIHKDYLNIRLDFYPDEDDKSYAQSLRVDRVTGETIVTSCLSHFIKVPVDITKEDLIAYIQVTFYADVTATIDDIVVQEDSIHLLSPFMRDKVGLPTGKTGAVNIPTLISNINSELGTVSIVSGDEPATPSIVVPESVDVGAAAINRPNATYDDFTYFGLDNPANADGTIDTVAFYAYNTITDIEFGTLYADTPPTFTCRDGTGDLGGFAGGLRQVTGLSIDIVAGDYIGTYTDVGTRPIDRSPSGNAGIYYSGTGNFITASASTTYTFAAGDAISVYGTGEEASGEPDISNIPPGTHDFGYSPLDSTVNTVINKWTITNNSGAAVSITVEGSDWVGGDDIWTLSDTATPGANTVGLKVGLDDADDEFDIIVRKNTPFNILVSALADEEAVSWGTELYLPTSWPDYDGQEMTGTITLVATLD